MLNWMKRRGPITYLPREPDSEPQPVMSGKYLLLYKYLQNRYADTVVLTFAQIESVQFRKGVDTFFHAVMRPPRP